MRSSRIVASLIGVALIFGVTASAAAQPTEVQNWQLGAKPAVYLIPHQDDETLTYSREVMNQFKAHNPIYFYLMTDGSHTGVCRTKIPLDAETCTQLRDEEFNHASHFLGVPDENIIKVADPATGIRPNDRPSLDAARRQIRWVLDDIEQRTGYGADAMWKTMSWEDDHSGHAVYGQALRELRKSGEVTDARWFLKRDYDGTWPDAPVCTRVMSFGNIRYIEDMRPEYWRMKAALYSYGIGQLSVPKNFDDMRRYMNAKYHTEERCG